MDPHTPTRQMAQSAAQKAQDAYATARQAIGRMEAMEARIQALEGENADLHARLARIEDQPLKVVPKRKAA